MELNQISEPDYFYHVYLSKEILAHGFPTTLPQVKGAGWDQLFIDKEYFFHVLSTLFYALGGEFGIKLLPLAITFVTMLGLCVHTSIQLGKKYIWIPLIFIFADTHFLFRSILVRPHVLAICLFTLLILAIYYRRKYAVLITSALFALSYHSLQVPIFFIFIIFAFYRFSDKKILHCLSACVLGLIIGVLINPYFPGNVLIIKQIFQILLHANSNESLNYGNEIYPMVLIDNFRLSLLIFFTFFFSFFNLNSKNASSHDRKFLWSLLTFALIFWSMTFWTSRAREYLVPTVILLLIQNLVVAKSWLSELSTHLKRIQITHRQILMIIIASLGCFQMGWYLSLGGYRQLVSQETYKDNPNFKALQKIPEDEKAFVLNCNWSDGPYMLYYRPNLQFLDLLDPSFLYLQAPTLHEHRKDFYFPKVNDLAFTVKNIFNAKYVLCDSTIANSFMEIHPNFKRLFPENKNDLSEAKLALFEVLEDSHQRYATAFLYKPSSAPQSEKWQYTKNELHLQKNHQETTIKTEYIDLSDYVQKESNPTSPQCFRLRPLFENDVLPPNTDFIAIGGGPHIRLYYNNQLLFATSGNRVPYLQKIRTFVPLPSAFKKTDVIEAEICSDSRMATTGFAVSLWSSKEMSQRCLEKGSAPTTLEHFADHAAYRENLTNCMGEVALLAGKSQ